MSERTCVQTVNRFGYPLNHPCSSDEWHGDAAPIFTLEQCSSNEAMKKTCAHHEPLYAEPVADTTAEVTREKCVRLSCTYPRDHGIHGPDWLTKHSFDKPCCEVRPPQPAADAHRHEDEPYAYRSASGDIIAPDKTPAHLAHRQGHKPGCRGDFEWIDYSGSQQGSVLIGCPLCCIGINAADILATMNKIPDIKELCEMAESSYALEARTLLAVYRQRIADILALLNEHAGGGAK